MQTKTIDPDLIHWFEGLSRPAKQTFITEALKASSQTSTAYDAFKRRYRDDWLAAARDCFTWPEGKDLTPYQAEILDTLPKAGRMAVRGPHGLGKTALAALVILIFALTSDGEDWKIITTASAWRQLQFFLWPEIHKWARRIRWDTVGRDPFTTHELLKMTISLETGSAIAVASDNPDLIEGAHADRLLYIFDESKAIIDQTFDAAEGAFSGAGSDTGVEAYALAISTPGEPNGRFYNIHKRVGFEDWTVRHVTLQEAMAAGRISQEWVENRQRQWGVKSAVFLNRVKGEFAASDEDTVIPLSWVELANERWHAWVAAGKPGEMEALGVDVGIAHDPSVFAPVYTDYKVDELRRVNKPDPNTATMQIAGRVKGILDANPKVKAVIDIIGIGAGVVHRLREQIEERILGFNAAEKTDKKDRLGELGFINKRSAAWWMMREILDPELGEAVALPPDDLLTGDLTTPKYRPTSGGKIQVESKDDLRGPKRLGRSTDSGDAVIQGLVGRQLSPGVEVMSLNEFLRSQQSG